MKPENQALVEKQREILTFRDLADGTVNTYISYLTQFIEWSETQLNKPVQNITWDEVRSYIDYLRKDRGIGNRTVNVHISQLHHFWHYVLKRDWDIYEVPFLKFDTCLPAVPTREEIHSIVDPLTNIKHRAELVLLYSSGIRIGELVRLRCGDICSSKGFIFISKSKNRSERYAILSRKALKILIEYIRTCYPSAGKEDWLFPGQKTGCHIDEQSVRNVFHSAVVSAGLEEKNYTPHSFRHAFGLHLYEAGTDILSIKEALGHKSLSSTEIYLTLGIGNGRNVKSPYDL